MEQSSCTALTPVPANGTRIFLWLEMCSRRKVLWVVRSEQHFQLLEHHPVLICHIPAAQACPCFTGREKPGVRVSLTKKPQPGEENNSNNSNSQHLDPADTKTTQTAPTTPAKGWKGFDPSIQYLAIQLRISDLLLKVPSKRISTAPSQADGKWVSGFCGPQDKVKGAHCQNDSDLCLLSPHIS